MARWAGTTAERGLGTEHRAERDRLLRGLKATGPRPCRRCSQPMVHPSACPHGRCHFCTLDLGHLTPRVLGGSREGCDLEHRRCNRAAGAVLGNKRRAKLRPRLWSRTW